MNNHTIKYLLKGGDIHFARCDCGWRSEDREYKQQVEDEVIAHQTYIGRVRAYLNTSTPSLKQTASYYRAQADHAPNNHDRELWLQLATEIERRLNPTPHKYEELPLKFSD